MLKKAPTQVYVGKMMPNTLPAGKYFVGDPVYFLNDSNSEDLADSGNCLLPNRCGFILHNISKGAFVASDKKTYSVESGMFGLIAVELGDYAKYTGDGSFHTFSNPVSLVFSEGSFTLKCGEKTVKFEQYEDCLSADDGYDSCG